MDFLLSILLGAVGAMFGGAMMARRTARRSARTGELDCGLRVTSGAQPGLTESWRHGVAKVTPGRIEFWPGAGGVFRPGGRAAVVLDVVSVDDRGLTAVADLRGSFSVAPGSSIATITTPTAVLEGAFHSGADAVAVLAGRPGPSAP